MNIRENVLSEDDIRNALINVITQIQGFGGSALPNFTDELVPMQDVEKFDSMTAVESLPLLEDEIGETMPNYQTLFFEPTGRARTLGAIVKFLHEQQKGRE